MRRREFLTASANILSVIDARLLTEAATFLVLEN